MGRGHARLVLNQTTSMPMSKDNSTSLPTKNVVRSSKEEAHACANSNACDGQKSTLQEAERGLTNCSDRAPGPATERPLKQPDRFRARDAVRGFFARMLVAARSNIYVQAAARGIAEGRATVRSWDESKVSSAAKAAATSTESSTAAPSRRDGQSGSGKIGFLGMLGGMAITAWMLFITLDGLRVQSSVDLGVVTSADGGFPLGGTGLVPVEGRGALVGRMFSMVQVNGGVFYPLYEPLVVEQHAPLVLLTLRNGRRHICDRRASVCARTADVAREIKVDRPAP